MAPSFRILLVDDFEPFRRFVRFALQSRKEFQIVAEAEDGLDAVQKATTLKPDLVLLDIGLPKLNGIAAAKQIRIVVPDTKIIFISLESSSVLVQQILRLGACGYVHKLSADSDLLPAIDAVLAGKQFVRGSVDDSAVTKSKRCHEVQFYSDENVLRESASRFLGGALKAGGGAIAVATRSHAEILVQKLSEDGFDMNAAIRQGTYISIHAADALSQFILNGIPDCVRFIETFSGVIQSCASASKKKDPRIAVFGEGANVVLAQGNTSAAIQIEKACNDLLGEIDADVMCAYPLNAFPRQDEDLAFKRICAEHTAVFSH